MSEGESPGPARQGRIVVAAHPLIEDSLSSLRDVETGVAGFRRHARLLKTLADGGPGELPTREAQGALDRLGGQ